MPLYWSAINHFSRYKTKWLILERQTDQRNRKLLSELKLTGIERYSSIYSTTFDVNNKKIAPLPCCGTERSMRHNRKTLSEVMLELIDLQTDFLLRIVVCETNGRGYAPLLSHYR